MLIAELVLVMLFCTSQTVAGQSGAESNPDEEAGACMTKMYVLWSNCQPLCFDSKIVVDYGESNALVAYAQFTSELDRCVIRMDQSGVLEAAPESDWPELLLVNPDYFASIACTNKRFSLTGLEKFEEDSGSEDHGFFRQPLQNYSAFGVFFPAWEMIANGKWKIESVSGEKYRNERCKKIIASTLAYGTTIQLHLWITRNGQCLKQSAISIGANSQTISTEFYYEDATHPIAKKIVISAPGRTETVTNENIVPNAKINEDIFYLAHYGFPEARGPATRKAGFPIWLKIFLVGLALVIGAAVFRKVQQRS